MEKGAASPCTTSPGVSMVGVGRGISQWDSLVGLLSVSMWEAVGGKKQEA